MALKTPGTSLASLAQPTKRGRECDERRITGRLPPLPHGLKCHVAGGLCGTDARVDCMLAGRSLRETVFMTLCLFALD